METEQSTGDSVGARRVQKFGVGPVGLRCLLHFQMEILRWQDMTDCAEKPRSGSLPMNLKHLRDAWQDPLVELPRTLGLQQHPDVL